MIDGVKIKQLRIIPDERGRLMEILRADDEIFEKFGQVYMTTVYPGVVKAWHYHKKQDDHFSVVRGMMKLVIYDDRDGSPTRGEVNELFLGDSNSILVKIPRGVYHGFKGIGIEETIVINVVTEPYNPKQPDEYRLDPHENDVPYEWDRKDG